MRRALVPVAAGTAAALLALARPASAAPAPKPWMPPGSDSLVVQVEEAKVKFQSNKGDSIGGANYKAYELVGLAARRALRAIGRQNMIQARAVEAVLDSLGLSTDLVVDPVLPYFAFLMVRNPYNLKAKAVGFLYWWMENDLRMQGAQFSGGTKPLSRVWWTGNETFPYSWGIADFARDDGAMHFSLFRLTPAGLFWTLAQYEDSGYRLGGRGSATWVDIDGDERPELVAYLPGERDSLFLDCKDCPKPIAEMTFAERPQGFALQDNRIVPSPYSTLERFLRLLVDGNKTAASRLLDQPEKLANAIANGWTYSRAHCWKVDYTEEGTSWPAWMVVRFLGPKAHHRYTFYFEVKNGHWVIRDWIERTLEPTIGRPGDQIPPPSVQGPPPGRPKPAGPESKPKAGK